MKRTLVNPIRYTFDTFGKLAIGIVNTGVKLLVELARASLLVFKIIFVGMWNTIAWMIRGFKK